MCVVCGEKVDIFDISDKMMKIKWNSGYTKNINNRFRVLNISFLFIEQVLTIN